MADTNVGRAPLAREVIDTITVDTIVPQVYVLLQYSTTGDEKAAALTEILQRLLSLGVYPSVDMAFQKGIPVGTFVVIDDPETPETDYSVQVVRSTRKRNDGDLVVDDSTRI